MFAIAAHPVATAASTVPLVPELACLPGGAMDTCAAEITVDHGDGDSTTCSLRTTIPVTIHNEDGSVTFTGLCYYGPRCGWKWASSGQE